MFKEFLRLPPKTKKPLRALVKTPIFRESLRLPPKTTSREFLPLPSKNPRALRALVKTLPLKKPAQNISNPQVVDRVQKLQEVGEHTTGAIFFNPTQRLTYLSAFLTVQLCKALKKLVLRRSISLRTLKKISRKFAERLSVSFYNRLEFFWLNIGTDGLAQSFSASSSSSGNSLARSMSFQRTAPGVNSEFCENGPLTFDGQCKADVRKNLYLMSHVHVASDSWCFLQSIVFRWISGYYLLLDLHVVIRGLIWGLILKSDTKLALAGAIGPPAHLTLNCNVCTETKVRMTWRSQLGKTYRQRLVSAFFRMASQFL